MNAEIVLQVFLPYHETQNFARILAILTVPLESPYYAPFSSLVKKSQPIPRSYISNDISAKRDPSLRLLTDVVGLIKAALKEGVVHRALLAFWSGVVVDLLQTGGTRLENEEGTVKILVEAFVGVLTTKHGGKDVNVSAVFVALLNLPGCNVLSTRPPLTESSIGRSRLPGHSRSPPLTEKWCGPGATDLDLAGHVARATWMGEGSWTKGPRASCWFP